MKRTRPGLILIEFVVLIAILLILLGLLLPAVLKVREAADRAKCQNHLRQIGGGFHAYHDCRGRLPPGGDNFARATTACRFPWCRGPQWSWAYHILPHVGQGNLHQEPWCETIFTTPVGIYHCPSRRPARLYGSWAKLDYAANAGTHPHGLNGVVMRTRDGQLRLADIADGTAGTVLLAEKRLNTARFGRNPDDDESFANAGWSGDWEVYRIAQAPPAADFFDPEDKAPRHNFGSSHPGVFNVVFCDGSVRTIRFSVSLATWQLACIRDDNEAFNPGDQ